jgi:hypothetical protein
MKWMKETRFHDGLNNKGKELLERLWQMESSDTDDLEF